MRRKYFYITGSILLCIAIILIIYSVGSDEFVSQQTFSEETEIEEENDIEITEEHGEAEPPKEEIHEEEPKALPEIISEAVQSTINYFQNNPTNIVAIGDSLTQGVGDSTNQNGYIGILERTINANGEVAQFENFGKRGLRSVQLLNRLDDEEVSSAIQEANIILITIGANDIMQVAKENIMNLSLHDFIEERVNFENNLREVIAKLKDLNKEANIYLVGFYNPFEKYFQDIEELNMIVETYNSTSESIADENEKVTFIPTVDLFKDEDINLFADDNFHPNYQGYHRIAERVLNYITNEES
ncbi:GDSL-type esterase/lipase family protein [Oceanobacillus salinisoli]|uniref:GDSL-type esterase/lipase family protein n=1 Tax=Oceanobacillus salinisoli TaxID=2678611 RepID=UPI0012E15B23|nr:GDSL-type esterase/lipase family protein [Oceanobacillus salinisoli]